MYKAQDGGSNSPCSGAHCWRHAAVISLPQVIPRGNKVGWATPTDLAALNSVASSTVVKGWLAVV
jgi:hypothetical protein